VNAVALSPDGRFLVSGGDDNAVKLWSLLKNQAIKSRKGHLKPVLAVVIGPDGRWLVSGGADKTIQLWSMPEGNHKACLLDLKASPRDAKGIQYRARNELGETVTYTLPCGAPIPAGSVCVCNCVPGSACSCVGHSSCSCVGHTGRGGSTCSCVPVHYWHPN
jgi:WD40 repeat protein